MSKVEAVAGARFGADDRVHTAVKIVAIRDALGREGVPAAAALAGTPLDPDAPVTAATRVSLSDILRVCANATRLTSSEHFALHVGCSLHVASYGQYGFGLLSGTNYRGIIDFATRYHLISAPLVSISFEEVQGMAAWVVELIPHPLVDADVYRYILEMQYGQTLTLHRELMGQHFAFDRLDVKWSALSNAKRSAAVLGCHLEFERPRNRFIFQSAWLEKEAHLGNPVTLSEVVGLCDLRMKEIDETVGMTGRVRAALLRTRLLPRSIESVADEFGTTARTLRRRLAVEGTTFRDIQDALRRDLALSFLHEKGRTVEEIAFALGFSDASNFRHAFRRWTSRRPRRSPMN